MQFYKLKFRKWYYYLIPGARRWLKEVEKTLNTPEIQEQIDGEFSKKFFVTMNNLFKYGYHCPPIDSSKLM